MGKFGGTFTNVPEYNLGEVVVREAVKKASIESSWVNDLSCRHAGDGPEPALTASVKGGIPESAPAVTLNMACPSGMRALPFAPQSIRLGEANIILISKV